MSFTAGPNGFGIWKISGGGASPVGGAAMRIAQDPVSGALWVVNVRGEIWTSARGDGSDWVRIPGQAVDVCAGPKGVFVVGTNPQ